MGSILQITQFLSLIILATIIDYSYSLPSSYIVMTGSHGIRKRQASAGDNVRITKLHVK